MENLKKVVIFKGSGKIFCAGGDVKEIVNLDIEQTKEAYRSAGRTFDLLSKYKIPFITLVDGLAMGGAATFAVPARYRIATERTSFGMPETAIGYFNDAGGSYFLPRLPKNFGVYLGMTGVRVNGFDMKKVGLSSHFVESSKLEDLEKQLIDCRGHEEVSKVLQKFETVPESIETELDTVLPKIESCFGASTVEEIFDRLARDGSGWATKTLAILNKMSPTSLKVTHRSITLGRSLSLRECMNMEYRLVIQHNIKSDLKEGCRAVLVDKDFKPKWDPQTLPEVTEEKVARFFMPMPNEFIFETEASNKL